MTYGSADDVTKEEILEMRAQYPNILVNEQSWDTQVEAQRVAEKGLRAYCVHPTVHADTQSGPVRAMAKHKLECWSTGTNSVLRQSRCDEYLVESARNGFD